MNQIPLWKQYGFSSEAEFRKRYPETSHVQRKPKTKRGKAKSRSRKR